jgi:hypothetical protein
MNPTAEALGYGREGVLTIGNHWLLGRGLGNEMLGKKRPFHEAT